MKKISPKKNQASKTLAVTEAVDKCQLRKNPIHINEEFLCGRCHKPNEKASGTCRNHCRFCLYSRHVDREIPGDRASTCQQLMFPVSIEFDRKKGYQILHQCLGCDKEILNRAAEDDDQNMLIRIMQNQNVLPPKQKNWKKYR